MASTAPSASQSSVSLAAGRANRRLSRKRADEDVVLLRDQGDVPAHLLGRKSGKRNSAHLDRAGARRVQARHQSSER